MRNHLLELRNVHDEIAHFARHKSGFELEELVDRAIEIAATQTNQFNVPDFELRRDVLIKELTHTRDQEVKLFKYSKKGKKQQLYWCQYYLTRDLSLYLAVINGS